MINLLPFEQKEQYRYGRYNSRLRRWLVSLTFGIVGIGMVTTGGMLFLQHSIDDYSKQVVTSRESLQEQQLAETKEHSQEITDSLKLVVNVLSREVLFSKLLTQIGKVTPANTVLTGLTIDQTQGGIDISADTSDYSSATQLQVNLADPANKIFSKADIQDISCTTTPNDPRYPCNIKIRALFSADNPFLFINKGGTK